MTTAVRRLVALAVALFVLSLAAPAGSLLSTTSSYMPGLCGVSYDIDGWASVVCGPGYVSLTPTAVRTVGLDHTLRIFVVAALVLVAFGVRRRRRRLVQAAVAVGAVGFLLGGASGVSRLVTLAAVVCLAFAVRTLDRDGYDTGAPITPPSLEPTPAPR